jgi:hypothetical protein
MSPPVRATGAARGARHGRSEPSASDALASRRSTAVLAGVSRPRLFDFRPGFLGRGSVRALPALACPSPAAAPRAPAVIPADMMPEAARERFARPPAGTALAPLSGSHLESALVERDGGAVSRDGEEGQEQSIHLIVQLSKPRNSNPFVVKQFDVKCDRRSFEPTKNRSDNCKDSQTQPKLRKRLNFFCRVGGAQRSPRGRRCEKGVGTALRAFAHPTCAFHQRR